MYRANISYDCSEIAENLAIKDLENIKPVLPD